jgi:hypothetical protein
VSARVTALGAGDLDGDGTDDVIVAYKDARGAFLVFHRVGVDEPKAPARSACSEAGGPLGEGVRLADLPEPARVVEFVDADGDGDRDVVAESSMGHRRYVLRTLAPGRRAATVELSAEPRALAARRAATAMDASYDAPSTDQEVHERSRLEPPPQGIPYVELRLNADDVPDMVAATVNRSGLEVVLSAAAGAARGARPAAGCASR